MRFRDHTPLSGDQTYPRQDSWVATGLSGQQIVVSLDHGALSDERDRTPAEGSFGPGSI
jgi:hypothetical protein